MVGENSLGCTASSAEFNPLVSLFPNAYENLPTDIHAAQFIEGIRRNAHKLLVETIRIRFKTALGRGVEYSKAKRTVDTHKKKLPSVSFAGVLPMRDKNAMPRFTGLLPGDLDLLGERLEIIRAILRNDPCVYALYVSPTGEGLKAIYRVPICNSADEYKLAFAAVSNRVEDLTSIVIDKLEDFTRLCFASHDPDAYLNPNAIELPVDFSHPPINARPPYSIEKSDLKTIPFAVESRRVIAERILGTVEWKTDILGYCHCPGEAHHTTGEKTHECQIYLDGAPTAYCVHKSCKSAVAEANRQLRSEIGKAEKPAAPTGTPQSSQLDTIASSTQTRLSASPEIIVLPSGAVSISESARVIFQRLAALKTLFWRGGVLVELVEADGVQSLDVLKPEKFRSDAEKLGQLYAWRAAGKGEPALKPSKMSFDDAKAIMAASESREFLPSVTSVLRCPVLTKKKSGGVAILGKGYHAELGGLLIVAGATPSQIPIAEAVKGLHWLVEEFDFQTEADRSRALAAFLTPALRIGGLMCGNIPIDCAEANKSQSGKGHRLEMVCTLYNEKSYFVTGKAGGVGSVDESFATALVSARPFICLDNFRGRMDSQNLEAFLTCPSLFPCRIPHHGEVRVDPKRFILQLSSNGLETTRDLANRASICRIRKRSGFQFRDTLGELQRRQPYFLGCVYAIISEWIASGKPRTNDTRHDFREWCQTLDWIVQNILGCAPLMDGHQAAQDRTSNPALSWLRAVALAVAWEERLGIPHTASEIVEFCKLHNIEILGKPTDDSTAKWQVGSICKQAFRNGDTVLVDGFTINRGEKAYRKPSGDMDTTPAYTFTK